MNLYSRPLVLVLTAALLTGCREDDPAARRGPPPPPPVSIAEARLADVPITIRAVGQVESRSSVVVRPQVAGRIVELCVAEGADVEAGEVLLRLDPRRYEALVREAEAALARARAGAQDARDVLRRNREALSSAAISQREIEQSENSLAAAEAGVQEAEAQLDWARLNLAYCTIAAPFSGRLGAFFVRVGSIVKENDTNLVELSSIDPIDASFAVPEVHLRRIREAHAASPPTVQAFPADDPRNPVDGALTFIENRVDSSSGTIRLKATFPNPDRRLWPGQFAGIVLTVGLERSVVVVPRSAVVASQGGSAVYVLGPGNTVELRPVRLRRDFEDLSLIEGGVGPGETVVTEGQLRLAPGAVVSPRPLASAGERG